MRVGLLVGLLLVLASPLVVSLASKVKPRRAQNDAAPNAPGALVLSDEAFEAGILHYSHDLARLHAKLAAREPITVVALGGSVTAGQGCPAPRKGAAVPTYDAELVALLNARLPASGGRAHVAVNKGHHGANLVSVAPSASARLVPWLVEHAADVLVLEFALNDEVGTPAAALAVRRAAEAVARRALEARAALAVVVLDIPNGRARADRASMLADADELRRLRWANCSAPQPPLTPPTPRRGDPVTRWPNIFGAAEWHHDVACRYGGVAQLSLPTALAAELAASPAGGALDACVRHEIRKGENQSCGLYAGFHLGCWGHRVAAGLLYRALARDPADGAFAADERERASAGGARAPASPAFLSADELRADFDALFVADDQMVVQHVAAAHCVPELALVPEKDRKELCDQGVLVHDCSDVRYRLPDGACQAAAGAFGSAAAACAGGWIGPRGTFVNVFHTAGGTPKHAGVHFVGAPCGQQIALDFVIANATRAVSGYRVRLLFVHSYESFGNFTTRVKVAGEPGAHVRELSGRWAQRTSVPSAEVIANLPASAKGKPIRVTVQAAARGNASDHKIAITGLRVLEAAIDHPERARRRATSIASTVLR